MVMLRHEVKNV